MTVTVTSDQVRAWCAVPETALPDDQLDVIVAGEIANQARICRIDPTLADADLEESLYRRCARAIAARGVPLGVLLDAGEYGAAGLKRFDGEIERLEGPTRIFVFG